MRPLVAICLALSVAVFPVACTKLPFLGKGNTNGQGYMGGFRRIGYALTHLGGGDTASHVALQPGGKILVLGSTNGRAIPSLVRYLPDGVLDGSFGQNGIVSLPIPSDAVTSTTGETIATMGSDGRPLFVFCDGVRIVVSRFTSDGVPDTGFGTNGQVTTTPTAYWVGLNKVFVAPDGNLFVVGKLTRSDGPYIFVARYSSGGVETLFASHGSEVAAVNIGAIAVDSAGGMYLGGYSGWDLTIRPALVKLTSSGELDANYADEGKLLLPQSLNYVSFSQLAVHGSGLIAALQTNDGRITFGLERIDAMGALDRGNWIASGAILPGSEKWFKVLSLAVTPGLDLLVMGGLTGPGTPSTPAVRYYDSSGAPVAAFGNQDGMEVPDPNLANGWFASLVLSPDQSHFVAVGTAWGPNRDLDALVARHLMPTGALDLGFGMRR